MTYTETPVLIVGGGPVGLALAVQLDRFGIDHVVVERQTEPTRHPKARGLTARSMETFRLWGLDDRIRAGSLQPDAEHDTMAVGWVQHYCESVTGRVLGVTSPEPSVHSPVAKCNVAQDVVERVLSDAVAGNQHTVLRRGSSMESFETTADGVRAVVTDLATGEACEVRARFLVACDGAASGIRDRLGVEMVGPGTLEHMASYFYRADASHLPIARRTASFILFPTDPAIPGGTILASDSKADRWLYLQRLDHPDQPLLTESQLVEVTRAHWGIPDLDVELVSALRWRMRAEVPVQLRHGPVILAGDAAHCIPPTGGLGLNTGLGDVVNLGWKLAAVLRGWAPDRLLDTYDTERRPVARDIMEWSVENHHRLQVQIPAAHRDREQDVARWRESLLEVERHTHSEAMAMGYVYTDGAIVDDGSPVPPVDRRRYWPTDRPGARFPHMWLDPEEETSTIDWFDTDFVLVCGPEADEWRAAGERLVAAGDLPLVVRSLPWMTLPVGMGAAGAVLVRPDGHVAWRPPADLADKEAGVKEALLAVLGGGA
ncbi:tetracenomycin A2 monooxygenase-dioxygenase [Pseudonocardia thermophila]|uniref:Tetracenomycin A2 monooxygenase-dioxygenase n=1 Tax=Pseudonocardia thermophila TaxID=1848 RepID=A0A1M6P4D5_PSETH|nr:FAD-dependent monooxygenase [Pseudonocardia thermophila]SHK02762.1 tetracenomycin A2 monooxygenase-dioxygenase [Pseudonocardia thermophila]